jgi:hypothetical protein
LFAGNKLHVAVLTDIAQGQKGRVELLRRSKILQQGHILTTSDFCAQDESDVEDLLGKDLYVKLVNATFGLKGRTSITAATITSTGEKSARIVKQIESAMRLLPALPEFDHYAPAAWLLAHPDFLQGDDPATVECLDRFEKLFAAVNQMLPTN